MSYFAERLHTVFRKETYLPYSKHLKTNRLLTHVVWINSCITLVFAVLCVHLRFFEVRFKARIDGRDLEVIFEIPSSRLKNQVFFKF